MKYIIKFYKLLYMCYSDFFLHSDFFLTCTQSRHARACRLLGHLADFLVNEAVKEHLIEL